MRIKIKNSSVYFGKNRSIKMKSFPKYYEGFLNKDTGYTTANVEILGASLVKGGLGDVKLTNEFVWEVCRWGGPTGYRVHGNLCRYQREGAFTKKRFANVVADSARMLQNGDLESAINKITDIKGLRISYGSKILRMLLPQKVGVYDKILKDNLSYPLNANGYVEFCADCKMVANELNTRGIESPHAKLKIKGPRKKGEWFVADVEAVIFHVIRHGE